MLLDAASTGSPAGASHLVATENGRCPPACRTQGDRGKASAQEAGTNRGGEFGSMGVMRPVPWRLEPDWPIGRSADRWKTRICSRGKSCGWLDCPTPSQVGLACGLIGRSLSCCRRFWTVAASLLQDLPFARHRAALPPRRTESELHTHKADGLRMLPPCRPTPTGIVSSGQQLQAPGIQDHEPVHAVQGLAAPKCNPGRGEARHLRRLVWARDIFEPLVLRRTLERPVSTDCVEKLGFRVAAKKRLLRRAA